MMQSYASYLLPSFLRCCSCCSVCPSCCGPSSCTAISLCQLVCCSGLLQPLLYNLDFAVHAGIACLAFLTCDWFCLYAGITCLTSLACDWPAECWDSLVALSMLGSHVYFPQSMIRQLHARIACLQFLLLCLLAPDWLGTSRCF